MNDSEKNILIDILTHRQVASLAVMVDDAPFIGLLPFAIRPDFKAFLVHASKLAIHSKGLYTGAVFSLLVHELETPEADPLQIVRASFTGAVAQLDKQSEAYGSGREHYINKYPMSEQMFGFQDFHLYDLEIKHGRFVAGFGKIYNLSPGSMKNLVSFSDEQSSLN